MGIRGINKLNNFKLNWRGPKVSTYSIALLGVLMALSVVVSKVGSIRLTRELHLSVGFIVTIIIAFYFGPLWTAGINGIINLLVFFMFPSGDPFFIGYTLSAVVAGLIYGLFFYPAKISVLRSIIAVSLVTLIVNLFMNGLWGSMLYHIPFKGVITARLLKQVLTLVPQIIISYLILKGVATLKLESKLN